MKKYIVHLFQIVLIFVFGFASGRIVPIELQGQRNLRVCEFQPEDIEKMKNQGKDINFRVQNREGVYYGPILNQIFDVKCQNKDEKYDRSLAIIYLKNGGVFDIKNLEYLSKMANEANDKEIIELLLR